MELVAVRLLYDGEELPGEAGNYWRYNEDGKPAKWNFVDVYEG